MSSPDEDNPRTSNMYDIMDNDIENKPIPPPEPMMDPVIELFLRRGLRPRLRSAPALQAATSSLGAPGEVRGPHVVPPPGATRVPPLTSLGGWDEIITKDRSRLPEKRPYSSGFLNYMRYSHKAATDEDEMPSTDVSHSINAEEDESPSSSGQSQEKTTEGEVLSQVYSDKLKSGAGELSHLSQSINAEEDESPSSTGQSQEKTTEGEVLSQVYSDKLKSGADEFSHLSQSINAEEDESPSSTGQSQEKTTEGEVLSQVYSDKLKSVAGELSHLSHNTSLEGGEPHFKKMKTEVGESPSPHAVFQGALNKTVDELTDHLLAESVRTNDFSHFASYYPAIEDLPDPDEEDTSDSKLF